MKRLSGLVLIAAMLAAAALWWLNQPLLPPGAAPQVLAVDLGIPPRGVAQAVSDVVADAGGRAWPPLLYGWFRLSGQARDIRSGNYEIEPDDTPRSLLGKLTRTLPSLRTVTLVEGWNLRQVRQALARADGIQHDTQALTPEALMQRLGRPGLPAEGHFFPDTYSYAQGGSELAVLRRALLAMDQHLSTAWAQRAPGSPLKTPQEALTLASLIEKETGRASDRPLVAGVFVNRLRAGMPLQTDPSVIYGLGSTFDGNLRRSDLRADTPWNTYTRTGLPPTPIALPGRAALRAAVQPADTRALYFVARGDGSSEFSETLQAHNRAVNQYQRDQRDPHGQ